MNERIKELLLKAGWTRYEALDERNQKFTELIVQECIVIVSAGISNATDWDSSYWDQACENRAQAIKEHFGVIE